MHTINISANCTPDGPSTVSNAAAAAETGLAVIAMCEAVTLMLIARSGLILFLIATSAMMGIIEYEMCAVPANKTKAYVISGPRNVICFGLLRRIFPATV